MSLKHDLSETFYRDRFDGKTVAKCKFRYIVTSLCKLQSQNFFEYLLFFCLFFTYGKAAYQLHVKGSPNPTFM